MGRRGLSLSNPIRSPYKSLVVHNALVGKEKEDHSDDRRAESESWAECDILGVNAGVIYQSAAYDCFYDDSCKLYVAVQCLCLAVLVHKDDSKTPENIESEKEHWNGEIRVGEGSCASVNNANAVYY